MPREALARGQLRDIRSPGGLIKEGPRPISYLPLE